MSCAQSEFRKHSKRRSSAHATSCFPSTVNSLFTACGCSSLSTSITCFAIVACLSDVKGIRTVLSSSLNSRSWSSDRKGSHMVCHCDSRSADMTAGRRGDSANLSHRRVPALLFPATIHSCRQLLMQQLQLSLTVLTSDPHGSREDVTLTVDFRTSKY